MKKILLFVAMATIFNLGYSQTFTNIHNAQRIDWLAGKNYLGLPFGTTNPGSLITNDPGALFFNTTNSKVYVWNGSSWILSGSTPPAAALNLTVGTSTGLVAGTSTYTNASLIGLGANIQIQLNGLNLYNYGINLSFTFDNTTGAIDISPNVWIVNGTLTIFLNQ